MTTGTATVSLIDIGGEVTSEPMELGAAVQQARADNLRYRSTMVLIGFGGCSTDGCEEGFIEGRMCPECREHTDDVLIAG